MPAHEILRSRRFLVNFMLQLCYIFKCELPYLAMFKFFQCFVFACLTKDFLNVQAISYIPMVNIVFFSIFHF